mgnify:CR=1 FL=1
MAGAEAVGAGAAGDRRVIAGEGACDRALRGEPGFDKPFTYLSGRNHVCWNDGRCFDGASLRPRHYAAPLYVMLDALSAMVHGRVRPALVWAGLVRAASSHRGNWPRVSVSSAFCARSVCVYARSDFMFT